MTDETFADHASTTTTDDNTNNQNGVIKVGERTFNTLEEFTKSWENAQSHILTIEGENAAQKEALLRAKGVEDVLASIQSNTAVQTTQTEKTEAVTKDNLTKEDLENILNQRELDKTATANVNAAMTLAEKALGKEYIDKLDAKASELGINTTAAIALAKTSPEAFAKLFLPSDTKVNIDSSGDINHTAIPIVPEGEPSLRVPFGAASSVVIDAWNAAKPKIE